MFKRSARRIQGGKPGKLEARRVRRPQGQPLLEALEGRTLLSGGAVNVAPPSGAVTVMNSAVISGWVGGAADGPVQVLLTINGNQFNVLPDQISPRLFSALSSAPQSFSFAMPALKPGSNKVYVDAIDNSTGLRKRIRSGTIKIGGPTGRVEVCDGTTISGWALSPLEGGAAVNVVITVNGVAHSVVADAQRSDLVAKYGSAFHGFSYNLDALPPGRNTITVDVVDPFTGQTRRLKSVVFTNRLPKATVNIHTATELAGWVSDPDSASPVTLQIKVDGTALGDPFTANDPRKTLGKTGAGIGFDVAGDFAGKVVELFACDQSSNQEVLVWTNNHAPKGAVNTATAYAITGWAVDSDAPDTPVTVRVDIDGVEFATTVADIARADVQKRAGVLNCGYSVDISGLAPGSHVIKVYALDGQASSAAPVLLGVRTVVNAPPTGKIDSVSASAISGWVLDADLRLDPTTINVYVDESLVATTVANLSHSGLPARYGPNHGFSVELSSLCGLDDGSHSITVTGLDNQDSDHKEVVIYDGFINNHAPTGVIERITSATISGWAYDQDTTDPIAVDVYLDGALYTRVMADQADAAAPAANCGFTLALPPMDFGAHTIAVCASKAQGNGAVLIGSQTVTNDRPIGAIEAVTGTSITGWAADPNRLGESVQVQVYVNGVLAVSGAAGDSRPDLLALAPLNSNASFANYGFTLALPALAAGDNQIDVYALDLNNHQRSSLGSVTVAA